MRKTKELYEYEIGANDDEKRQLDALKGLHGKNEISRRAAIKERIRVRFVEGIKKVFEEGNSLVYEDSNDIVNFSVIDGEIVKRVTYKVGEKTGITETSKGQDALMSLLDPATVDALSNRKFSRVIVNEGPKLSEEDKSNLINVIDSTEKRIQDNTKEYKEKGWDYSSIIHHAYEKALTETQKPERNENTVEASTQGKTDSVVEKPREEDKLTGSTIEDVALIAGKQSNNKFINFIKSIIDKFRGKNKENNVKENNGETR